VQAVPQLRRHFCGRGSDGIGQFEYQLLIRIEEIAFLKPIQVTELIVADARLSASGRINIDSKWTLNQLGGAYLRQNFQTRRDQIGLIERLVKSRVRNENRGMGGDGLQRSNISAQALACHAHDYADLKTLKHLLS